MGKLKAKIEDDREALEAQLMGGEIQEEPESTPEPEAEPAGLSVAPEPEPEPKPEPEVSVDELKTRLAKAEKERHDFEQAMREEREAKKTANRTLQSLVERLEKAQIEKEAQEPREKPPVYEEDPAAYLKWQNEQIMADRGQEKQQREEETKRNEEIRQYQQLHQTIKQGINEYAENVPDYNDAAKYLIESRIKELKTMGISGKEEVMQTLQQEEVQVGYWALQKGMSPGELIYNLATIRGYQKLAPANQPLLSDDDKPKVKSLSNISGTPSGNKESLQARADKILAATNLKDIMALNQDDMEKILRETR